MIRVYLDIDKNYADSVQNLDNELRIDYLEKIIDEKQNILSKSGSLLSPGEKMKLMEVVKSAQNEIREIRAS